MGDHQAEWFAGRLYELREEKGLTQAQLAKAAGLTREGVAQLETGRRKPLWETVLKLVNALAVPCDAFLTPPASRPSAGPARPARGKAEEAKPRRPRGRPRKR